VLIFFTMQAACVNQNMLDKKLLMYRIYLFSSGMRHLTKTVSPTLRMAAVLSTNILVNFCPTTSTWCYNTANGILQIRIFLYFAFYRQSALDIKIVLMPC
jgi:hypothetical protein